jgi:condensin complex subunit 1
MLARAKREIMTERVETLLKIGLGPFGKVSLFSAIYDSSLTSRCQADLVLARYTCIALQRLSGSAKKVKGKWDVSVLEDHTDTQSDRLSFGQDRPTSHG